MTYMVSHTTQSVSRSSFEELFASKTLSAVLARFALEPDRTFYQRELMRVTGTTLHPLQRELARLERMGLVRRKPRGKHVEYSIDVAHPTWTPLRTLLLRTVALGDALGEALSPLAESIDAAFIYGPFASGDTDSASDIALMGISEIGLRQISDALHAANLDLGWEINPSVYRPKAVAEKLAAQEHFVTSVIDGPKIWLVGDDEQLAESTGRGRRQSSQILR